MVKRRMDFFIIFCLFFFGKAIEWFYRTTVEWTHTLHREIEWIDRHGDIEISCNSNTKYKEEEIDKSIKNSMLRELLKGFRRSSSQSRILTA